MAPSNRANQSSLAKGVAAWTYVQRPDKSPLRPLIPILRTRWVNDLYKWIGKQDERFPELIAYGFYSVKGDMVFSTLEQATDYHNGYLKQYLAPQRCLLPWSTCAAQTQTHSLQRPYCVWDASLLLSLFLYVPYFEANCTGVC